MSRSGKTRGSNHGCGSWSSLWLPSPKSFHDSIPSPLELPWSALSPVTLLSSPSPSSYLLFQMLGLLLLLLLLLSSRTPDATPRSPNSSGLPWVLVLDEMDDDEVRRG